MQNLAAHLRTVTQSIHQAVEDTPVVRQALSPGANGDAYVALLEGFYRAHSQIGNWREALSCLPYAPFDRLERLRADLRYFGKTLTAEVNKTPLQPPQAWGVAYVVEGSVLGAAAIRAAFGPRLAVDWETGGSYLWGYGAQNRSHWVRFCSELDDWARQFPHSVSLAENAACETFALFRQALQ